MAAIRRMTEVHERLLRQVEDTLADSSETFLLLFGRGLRAEFSEYRHGFSNDIDIYTADIRSGLSLLDTLLVRGGFSLTRQRTSRVNGVRVAHFRVDRGSDEGHHLAVDLICGGRPVGPGLLPPFVPQLLPRAHAVDLRGRKVLVPSFEDMLLMVAEKTKRHAGFIRLGVNDVRFILTFEELDWGYVERAARKDQLGAVLHHLVVGADHSEGGRAYPPSVLRLLAPGPIERTLIHIMTSGTAGRSDPAVRRRRTRAWRVYWFAKYVSTQVRSPRAVRELMGNLFETDKGARRIERRALELRGECRP